VQVNAFEPIGQSFTAEDSAISFAFNFDPLNPGAPNDPLQVQLLHGDGLGGPILGSVVFSISPAGFRGFFDVDFSSIALTIGQVYTAVLSVSGTSSHWGVTLQQTTNPYPGGRAYFTPQTFVPDDPGDDMQFRVTPAISSVPVPTLGPVALGLLAVALAGLGFSRCKQ